MLFDVEYAQVMGIPFAFTAGAVRAMPTEPKVATHVYAVPQRAELEITFPRVEGFRVDLPSENLRAAFDENLRLPLSPREVGPCEVLMQGIVGEGITLTPAVIAAYRPSSISYELAKQGRNLSTLRFRSVMRRPTLSGIPFTARGSYRRRAQC